MKSTLVVLSLLSLASASSLLSHSLKRRLPSSSPLKKRDSCTISSLDDVDEAVKCSEINIESFEVPAGETFDLDLEDGTTVNVLGDITFGTSHWEGPLVQVEGTDITFNGNGYKWDGQGSYYWDGEGGNGGVTKPKFFKVKFSGTMTDVYLLNQPVQGFSISNPAALTMSGITVDCSDGDEDDLGHNTDAFDVSSSESLTIKDSTINNQDDCIAVNDAANLVFTGNTCTGGHGISIGSIKDGKNVSNVKITNNKVVNSQQGLRIKTYAGATDASVSDIYYEGNTVTGCEKYGVVIEQDYTNEGATGEATDGVPIDGVYFQGTTTTVEVEDDAKQVYILCASGACSNFDFSALSVSGGSAGSIEGVTVDNFDL
ncbi:hypothetical protein JCM8547_006958 [Rhodosporidiobolus lusitaniae]